MQTKTAFTSGLGGRHIYFRYNATSGRVGDNVVEPSDIQIWMYGLIFCFICAETVLLPVLGDAISISGIISTSGCVDDNVVEPGDIENMDVGVGILFLRVL